MPKASPIAVASGSVRLVAARLLSAGGDEAQGLGGGASQKHCHPSAGIGDATNASRLAGEKDVDAVKNAITISALPARESVHEGESVDTNSGFTKPKTLKQMLAEKRASIVEKMSKKFGLTSLTRSPCRSQWDQKRKDRTRLGKILRVMISSRQ